MKDLTDYYALEALEKYLLAHESDIANDINDFGDLSRTFYFVHDREPKK